MPYRYLPGMRLSREQFGLLRSLQMLWLIVFIAVAVLFFVALIIRFLQREAWLPGSDALFYACAFLNIGSLVYAFYTRGRARGSRPEELSERLVRAYHISQKTLLPMTAAALVAIFPVAVTDMWATILFLVPFFAYVLVFFPYSSRFGRR